jgi:hypothetical protein
LCALLTESLLVRRVALVDIDGTPIDLLPVHCESLFNGVGGLEVNITKSAGATSVTIHLYMGRFNFPAFRELLGQPVIVDVP